MYCLEEYLREFSKFQQLSWNLNKSTSYINSVEISKKELLNFLKRGNYVIREYKPIMSDKEK